MPLQEAGYDVRYMDVGKSDFVSLRQPDLLTILGGPIGVYEEDKYPFLTAEIGFVKERLSANRPTLGICLGAQLIAKALGSRVYPGRAKEIGWKPLTLTQTGAAILEPLRDMPVL